MKDSFLVVILLVTIQANAAFAYSEFYEYIRKTSGREINCAICHIHGEGPDGSEIGQTGFLKKDELEKLSVARAALEPGQIVNNPTLNEFGNELIHILGKRKLTDLVAHPEDLPKEIGYELDIDKDGIPDATEYLDGTLPTSKESGDPWKLFLVNIKKNAKQLLIGLLCVCFFLYGFIQLLRGIYNESIIEELEEK